jgi:hypothetical protein
VANVVINRCTLRLVRRGGWSWGPEPRKLLQAALNLLPALLARELSMVWPDDAVRQITGPIRIRVPIQMSELIAAAGAGFSDEVIRPPTTTGGVSARIAEAVRTAFQNEQVTSVTNCDSETQSHEEHQRAETEIAQAPTSGSAVLRLLIQWRMSGLLETSLAAFSLPALEAWHRRLIAGDAGSLDREAGFLDREAGSLDRVAGSLDREAGSQDREGGSLDREAGFLDREAGFLDREAGSPDRGAGSQEAGDGMVHDIPIAATTRASLDIPPETIDILVREIAKHDHGEQDDRSARLRRRIVIQAAAAARLKLQPGDPVLLAALDRALPLDGDAEPRLSEEASEFDTRQTHPSALPGEGELAGGHDTSRGGALLPLLLRWHASGVLETQLASFSPADLEAWHRRLIGFAAGSRASQSHASETIDQLLEEIAQRSRIGSLDRETTLRRRIVALVEAAARLNRPGWDPMLLAALDRAMPLSSSDAGSETLRTESNRESFPPGSNPPPAVLTPPLPLTSSRRRTRLAKQCHVRSALPFLLLGSLSQSGYLRALAATLEAADCQADSPLFAAALAYKVLDPPWRGWRRDQATIEAASAFAALEEPPAESELVDFARRISPHLSPLESALSGALIASRDSRHPLLLHGTQSNRGGGLLLLDVQGVFPLCWASDAIGLRRSLITLESSAVLISQATAEPELLNWMDREGFRFITDAVPTRGERWRALRRPPQDRWWTNDRMTPESELVRMARAMETAAEEAGTLWQSLAVERPSIPLADDPELDRHITLAASVALGTLAWALWRERESTAPHLALERFRDLDARVTYSRDAVNVSLPLGRRFQDLRDHSLANDVADVPWLGGRALTFSSG